jgi:hypothetical protein
LTFQSRGRSIVDSLTKGKEEVIPNGYRKDRERWWRIAGILVTAGFVGLGAWWLLGMDGMTERHSGQPAMGMSRTGGSFPLVTGFYEGCRVIFVTRRRPTLRSPGSSRR